MQKNLVLAEKNGRIYRTHRVQAEKDGAQVLDESPYTRDGQPKRARRADGRRDKPKTTVDAASAAKKQGADK